MNGWTGVLYRVTDWIMKLAYVNLLWIFFTLMGLIVLGWIPATVGTFAVVRKWFMEDVDIPVFKTFWQSYKTEFVKGNMTGWLMVLIGGILYIDIRFFQMQDSGIFFFLTYLFIAAALIYFIMMLFFFPIYVHYDLKIFQYVKQSFLIAVFRPLESIMMIIAMLAVYFLMIRILPGLIPFFGVSLPAFVLMWLAYRVFGKLEEKLSDVPK